MRASRILSSPATARAAAVRIVEVGPRDGLQNVKKTIPLTTKLELISRLRQTGLGAIEITSVVSPRAIPQLADCRALLADESIQTQIRQNDSSGSSPNTNSLRLPVLVPNLKGLEIALQNGVREVAVFVSATEGFSKANINATVDQGLARAREVTQRATSAGLVVRGYVSCIFADPFDGPTPQSAVLKVVRVLLDVGCYEVSLGDTLGVGSPADVKNLLEYLFANGIGPSKLAGHFHDTYGQAVANVWQAYRCGLRAFDSSVGGLGGCPFAPGAKGNAATEDLVYMFERAGCDTGVDLEKLVEVGNWISAQLDKPNESRAGVALTAKKALPSLKAKTVGQARDIASSAGLTWKLVSETESLRVYRSGVNLKVVLNQPKKGNALTVAMIHELTRLFRETKSNRSISRVAITSEGRYFCAGMDLGKGTSPVAQSQQVSDAQYERLATLFREIDTAPQVTVAAINGPAFGGGVGLAFACDVRIASSSTTMTLSEAKLGLCPATISKYVVREWGLPFTREAMLSARPVTAAELHSLGCVTKVVADAEELSPALDRYLTQLKISAPEASSMCKQLIKLGWTNPGGPEQEQGIKQLFDRMMRPDGEASIGLKAFQETRRPPDWDEITMSRSAATGKPKL
ncbi:putative secondary metabolism biosynthetic enzyme [Exophiala oligosperma]